MSNVWLKILDKLLYSRYLQRLGNWAEARVRESPNNLINFQPHQYKKSFERSKFLYKGNPTLKIHLFGTKSNQNPCHQSQFLKYKSRTFLIFPIIKSFRLIPCKWKKRWKNWKNNEKKNWKYQKEKKHEKAMREKSLNFPPRQRRQKMEMKKGKI